MRTTLAVWLLLTAACLPTLVLQPEMTSTPNGQDFFSPTTGPLEMVPHRTRPPPTYPPVTDYGSRGVVLLDGLRAYAFADPAFEVQAELVAGTEVFLSAGPVPSGGLDWYEVYFGATPIDPPGTGSIYYGWVATGPTGRSPAFLRIDPPHCPATVTVSVIAAMTNHARLACLAGDSFEVTGVLGTCTDYSVPTTPPEWLNTTCLNVSDRDASEWWPLYVYFPPNLGVSVGEFDGRVARVIGHVDDPAASECIPTEPTITSDTVEPAVADRDLAWARLMCRGNFVLTEFEVADIPS